jgi:hypothetical protein
MVIPAALPVVHRKRGNPNWGRPIPPVPDLATEFETQVEHLHLTAETYVYSAELHSWCEHNRNRVYVPEWLLKAWDIPVDPDLSGKAPLRRT